MQVFCPQGLLQINESERRVGTKRLTLVNHPHGFLWFEPRLHCCPYFQYFEHFFHDFAGFLKLSHPMDSHKPSTKHYVLQLQSKLEFKIYKYLALSRGTELTDSLAATKIRFKTPASNQPCGSNICTSKPTPQ